MTRARVCHQCQNTVPAVLNSGRSSGCPGQDFQPLSGRPRSRDIGTFFFFFCTYGTAPNSARAVPSANQFSARLDVTPVAATRLSRALLESSIVVVVVKEDKTRRRERRSDFTGSLLLQGRHRRWYYYYSSALVKPPLCCELECVHSCRQCSTVGLPVGQSFCRGDLKLSSLLANSRAPPLPLQPQHHEHRVSASPGRPGGNTCSTAQNRR